ncbi:MAG: hypothetical protein J7623_07950 [Chitinophaga sp.]|uniref:hypothetical protein n=1 Tax=Chitinophaga sp. TaxID=1869181 RepID=UPI001B04A519|nr:hypothetical protein [Chitinophaga sp.]MBO9728553.1 hypothetical protein [Chitinophaga sp.]
MGPIPKDYIDFLHWLKNHTEDYWSRDPETSTSENKCPKWIHGAKWIGMTDEQIDEVEERYGFTFTPDHRLFLKILHTIDRKERVYEYYGSEEGEYYECSFMRNWLTDDEDIKPRLNSVYDRILKDVIANKFWINSWGTRSGNVEERVNIFNEKYAKAPRLVPVIAHRYQVADLSLETNPVLSILGTDIVYYGTDFRHYLLKELSEHLNIYHSVFDEEDQVWYWEVNDEYKDYFESYDKNNLPEFPFWKSFVLFDWTNHANNIHL